ncbi:flagellar biosynthetic protein FliR [Pseudaeromonas sharmana]|uniref:Flagellar biosynthetic protein FliR n=1 Tax=Pseudaeromonas sharmana TaxID=328412 RepID=A0ABV8CN89_9GAMM
MSSLLQLSVADLTALLGRWWWPFVRISAAFWMLPLFGDSRISTPVRLLLCALLALLVAPLVPPMPVLDPLSLQALVLAFEQVMFGLIFGLCLQLLFMVMTLSGQILSLQMGLGMAMMNDPVNGDSAPILSQLMLVFCTLLFLSLNGHLLVLELLTRSFQLWPVGSSLYQLDLDAVIRLLGWSMAAALALTLPAVVAMLLVNLTFGVMNRAAPALNVISLGFPMTLMFGLLAVWLSVSGVPGRYLTLVEYALTTLHRVMAP